MFEQRPGDHTIQRITLILAAGALLLAACGGAAATDDDAPAAVHPSTVESTTTSSPSAGEGPASRPFPEGPSALLTDSAPEFPPPLVDTGEIISGGPPPDGIPPIDSPVFLDVADNLGLLPANEPVVALEINGDARAYPIRAMVWHEIVNDVVGGVPVAVTYCPLCNSAATYDRRIDGAETTFGTSGRLFASALVMYDRATESLWTHFDGRAVVGLLAGAELEEYASPLLAWDDFRTSYPTGKVLDWEETGFNRDYGRNPYTGYDDPDNTPFLFRGALDDRAAAMQRVVGVEIGDTSSAFTLEYVSDYKNGTAGLARNTSVDDTPIAIFWKAGQASSLDTREISGGRDIGSSAVFLPTVRGEFLTFEFVDGEFVDTQTGSAWSITGEALRGELVGERLERIPHLDTFWFAWSTYQPGTDLVGG